MRESDMTKEAGMKSSIRRVALIRAWIFGLGVFGVGAALPAQSVATVGELLAGVRVQPPGLQNYFVIPVAGHVQGVHDTEFRTDLTIFAGGPAPQRVAVAWLAQGVDSSAQPLDFFELGPAPAFFADMVASRLEKSGLGALVVAVVTPNGSLDSTARLTGFARVWTPVPGCSGTSSFAVEATRFTTNLNSATGLLLDSGHRVTVGVINPNAGARTFTGYFSDPTTEITVPPASMRQVRVPAAAYDRPISVFVGVDGGGMFAGYATSVDELSGDGWLVSFNSQ
jgi:hypothetical protein